MMELVIVRQVEVRLRWCGTVIQGSSGNIYGVMQIVLLAL